MIGQTLGQRYQLLRLLGRGGMGSVYEAETVDTRERFAVKVLHSHLLVPGSSEPRRFRREAAAALAVQSDHIVRVVDVGSDEALGYPYLVTELLDGEDLQTRIDRTGPVSLGAALKIAAQALSGLSHAHAAGVVHRDIKPANIFLARRAGGTMTVKLLDFGIAKIRKDLLGPAQTADLTTTGSFLGSPLYMSPEQVQNSRDVDPRTDVWSLGCVLYAALAGRTPHQHLSSLGQLLVAICVTPSPPLTEIAPWVPHEAAEVVHRALELRPEERFQTASAMLEAVLRLGPPGELLEAQLVSSGPPRAVSVSSIPPSPAVRSPRVVIAPAPERTARPDAATQHASLIHGRSALADETLSSAADVAPAPDAARSAVPAVGLRAHARHVTVDPRRVLGEQTELWTFSLDVHRQLATLIARVWKAMRRSGTPIPPMSYGKTWVLFEPRTGRTIAETSPRGDSPTLEEAGIRSGTILWIVRPDGMTTPE